MQKTILIVDDEADLLDVKVQHSEEDEHVLEIYQMIAEFSPMLWSVLCMICCALLYYQLMMKKPLVLLNDAVQHITDGNLDFTITYEGKNEFASILLSIGNHEKFSCRKYK